MSLGGALLRAPSGWRGARTREVEAVSGLSMLTEPRRWGRRKSARAATQGDARRSPSRAATSRGGEGRATSRLRAGGRKPTCRGTASNAPLADEAMLVSKPAPSVGLHRLTCEHAERRESVASSPRAAWTHPYATNAEGARWRIVRASASFITRPWQFAQSGNSRVAPKASAPSTSLPRWIGGPWQRTARLGRLVCKRIDRETKRYGGCVLRRYSGASATAKLQEFSCE